MTISRQRVKQFSVNTTVNLAFYTVPRQAAKIDGTHTEDLFLN